MPYPDGVCMATSYCFCSTLEIEMQLHQFVDAEELSDFDEALFSY